MIWATTKHAVFSTLPTVPSKRVRTRTRVITKPAELPLPMAPAKKDRRWLEDVLSLVMLCVVAGVVVAASAGMARDFFDQLLQYNSLDLLSGFRGM